MYKIPLFPLNMVLYPGVPITLHIFEERYKEMINLCIDENRPFGVVLINKGVAEFGPAEPYSIGCTAEIVQVERLKQGRLNIVAVGQNRFRIIKTSEQHSYLSADVENMVLEINEAEDGKLQKLGQRLRPWLEQYVSVLKQLADVRLDWDKLPSDPLELGYFSAYLLQVPLDQKQAFLQEEKAVELLEDLGKAYRTEIALLKSMVKEASARKENNPDFLFSLN